MNTSPFLINTLCKEYVDDVASYDYINGLEIIDIQKERKKT